MPIKILTNVVQAKNENGQNQTIQVMRGESGNVDQQFIEKMEKLYTSVTNPNSDETLNYINAATNITYTYYGGDKLKNVKGTQFVDFNMVYEQAKRGHYRIRVQILGTKSSNRVLGQFVPLVSYHPSANGGILVFTGVMQNAMAAPDKILSLWVYNDHIDQHWYNMADANSVKTLEQDYNKLKEKIAVLPRVNTYISIPQIQIHFGIVKMKQ